MGTERMDRFEELKNYWDYDEFKDGEHSFPEMRDAIWMLSEIERLRRIEDEAIECAKNGGGDVIDLEVVLQDNPRPK